MYLALDIGNVLVKVNFDQFIRETSLYLNLTKAEVFTFLERTQKLHDLGLTNIKEELKDHFHIKSEPAVESILKCWNKSLFLDNNILQYLIEFSKTNHVAILSNIGNEHTIVVKEMFKDMNYIEHFSCHVGARKPSNLFYQSFLIDHPEFKGCLYLDDIQANLDAGTKYKFKSVKFDLNDYNDLTSLEELKKIIETHDI